MNEYETNLAAIEHYGRETQMVVCIEEMAELIQAICKRLRGYDNLENFSEEMADVSIVLEQLRMMFPREDAYSLLWKAKKLERMEKRMARKRVVVRRMK